MSKDEFEIVPFNKHAKERFPNIQISQRNGHSPEIKGTLSVLGMIGRCHYVELYTNKSRTTIQIVPVEKQTAYSRGVSSDMISHCRIAGGPTLIEIGCKLGRYDMVEPMIFKYSSAIGDRKRHE